MAIQRFRKDPDAVLDYGFDWDTDGWLASGETLSSAVWTIPAGITKDSQEISSTTAKVWLSGGTAGESYTIACLITTTDSRTDERSFVVMVTDR